MDILNELDRWESQCQARKSILGFDTGFAALTRKIDGWQRSKFYVFTADTNIGKTDTLVNISRLLLKHNPSATVAYITLDDDIDTIIMRLISQIANITKNEAQNPKFRIEQNKYMDESEKKWKMEQRYKALRLIRSYIETQRLIIHPYDDCKTVLEIYKQTKDYNCIIVDGFHNLAPSRQGHSKSDEISEVTKEFKRFIKKFNKLGMVTAESRKSQQGNNTFVGINDLAESRSLKYEPDMIITLNSDANKQGNIAREVDLQWFIPKNKTSGFKGDHPFVLDRYTGICYEKNMTTIGEMK